MKTDFSECEFIEDKMQFYTYHDFCRNCKIIKSFFNKLSKNGKVFYHYYVYANIHMNETFKNAIWDFLNFGEEEYYIHLKKLEKIYKAY